MAKIINVLGTGRSGTTLIDLILGNDKNGFSLGEIYAWFRPFRTHHFNIVCSCDSPHCPWKQLKHLKEKDFFEKAFEILKNDFFVDSSKFLPWVIDSNERAISQNIIVHNILLYKEPINLIYSFWKRGRTIKNAIKAYKKYYSRFFQTSLPFIALNYNRFVSNPEDMLQRLCTIINIPYFHGKENFWEKEHHHLFGSLGTRKQNEKKQGHIKAKDIFLPEFEKIIPKINLIIKNDIELKEIKDILDQHHLIKYNADSILHYPQKPYWYYFEKYRIKYRQYFPEKWHLDQ
ncbi:MAG: sulfotransferase [Desulfobacula sp.]|uniref:hypothetical protein n=1 Tax=Desulfobacula sp. TaxID=2593537 RepID=UPI0025BE5556|nr:hypothetical protein [Desulfobacula sp.]MCD4720412.1 sulfotransferase [Desulfobacula sp.]